MTCRVHTYNLIGQLLADTKSDLKSKFARALTRIIGNTYYQGVDRKHFSTYAYWLLDLWAQRDDPDATNSWKRAIIDL
jgi:hypothetical protein